MMKTDRMKISRSAWILFSGLAALLLVVGLSLLLSHLQVRAQPAARPGSDLEVTKDVSAAQAGPGNTLRYTVTIENSGSDAVDTWMTDTLPTNLVDVSNLDGSGDFGFQNRVITWSLHLDVFGRGRLTFQSTIATDTTESQIVNVAQVTGTGSLVTDSATTRIQTALENEDTYKTVDKDFVAPGSTLAYTIVLSNSYASDATFAKIVDPLDPWLDYVEDSAQIIPDSSGTLDFFDTQVGSTGITWTVIISPSSAVTLAFQAVVSDSAVDGTVINNTATINESSSSFTRSVPVTVTQRPLSQIRSPNRDAYITEKGTFKIKGAAWIASANLPFLSEDPQLSVDRVNEKAYLLSWTPVVSASFYLLEEAPTSQFISATTLYYGSDREYPHVQQDDGTYYYRVKADATGLDPSRWSNVESVTVPWLDTNVSAPASALFVKETTNSSVTVQVRIDDGDWHTATVTDTTWGGWEWSWDWSMPEERNVQHVIQSRAAQPGGSFGPTDAITVTLDNKNFLVYLPLIFKRWPPINYPPVLDEIENPNHQVDYTVSWSYSDDNPDVPPPDNYTLEEATKADFSDAESIYEGLDTSYPVTDTQHEKENGTYYYRVRGNNTYGPGEWSNVESTEVRVTPYAPTLNIDNPDEENSYTVNWGYPHDYPPADFYTLQEAKDAPTSFDNVYTGSDNSYPFTDKDEGIYYYRVRAHNNSYGAGDWSDTKSTTVVSLDFYDDFSDPNSGWRTHEADCCLDGCDNGIEQEHPNYKYNLYYEDGRYRVKIPLDCRAQGGKHGDTRHIYPVVFAPGIERPADKTCIEVKGRFERWDPYWSFWGVVFAASEDKSTVYSLEVNNLGDWAIVKRTKYDFPGPNAPYQNENRDYIEPYTGEQPRDPANPAFTANTLRVEIEGDKVDLYINGKKVRGFSASEISSLRYVGMIGGDWEITPTQIGYDYFYMDVGCDDY